jgi:membrane-bound transcription factor site-1 protease
MSVTGKLVGDPVWNPYKAQNGELIQMAFKYSDVIWPWSGYLAIYIQAKEEAR